MGIFSIANQHIRFAVKLATAIVLALLSVVGLVLALVAAIAILLNESYPDSIYGFLRGLVRWEARLLGYLASLVDAYPPFALDLGAEGRAALPPTP